DTSTAGGAVTVGGSGIVLLDTVSAPHCESSCQAPIKVSSYTALITNNVTFTNPGSSGVDILFEQDSFAMLGCDSLVSPQVWVDTTGPVAMYKEGDGVMEIKAASSIDLQMIVDAGTLVFSDTTTEPLYALSSGTLEGTSTSYYIANMGLVKTGLDFGTITNTFDYYQTSGSNVVVKIDDAANTDLIHALE